MATLTLTDLLAIAQVVGQHCNSCPTITAADLKVQDFLRDLIAQEAKEEARLK